MLAACGGVTDVRLVFRSPLIDPFSGSEFGGSSTLARCPQRGWVVPEESFRFFEHQPLLLPSGYGLISNFGC